MGYLLQNIFKNYKLNYRNFLAVLNILSDATDLGHSKDGVVVRDDQPLPICLQRSSHKNSQHRLYPMTQILH